MRTAARAAACLLAAAHLGAALLPCPPADAGAPLAREAAPTHVSHAPGEAPCPHHASAAELRPAAKLSAACPCGCAEAPGPAAVFQARLGVALLHTPPALPVFHPAAPPAGAAAALPEAPTRALDHVPLAALA